MPVITERMLRSSINAIVMHLHKLYGRIEEVREAGREGGREGGRKEGGKGGRQEGKRAKE